MKWYLFPATVIFLIACNEQAKKQQSTPDTVTKEPKTVQKYADRPPEWRPPEDPEEWFIPTDIAVDMIDYFSGCHGNCLNISEVKDSNLLILKKLRDTFGKKNVKPVVARYKSANDRDRYCKLRGITDPVKCDVLNYKTIIFKVTTKSADKKLLVNRYYDIVTICPPPSNCLKDKDSSNSIKIP